ncbi:MAG: ribosome recycling factor [Candidatus Pacebacteria bacterium CG10_big_fil_rev_8_21_14_0_10_56_10]|nr:MAG: ribosome recycling factor [Candidatus Pacebacteria bacterium CG10_big_fil_rev_8_21_14_0_10_56_10]
MAFDFSNFSGKIDKTIDHIHADLASLRSSKAVPQLLDPVRVELYGNRLKVQEVASISIPNAELLLVSPWDKNVIGELERAIAKAGLNLNPVVDGDVIRIVVPPLTAQRRREMVSLLHQKTEDGKVMLRNIRTATKQAIEAQRGQAGVSDDDVERDLARLDDLLGQAMTTIDKLVESKESDLMKV